MKKYIKISSKGAIDINAFTLFGASTKKGDNSKIGQWGSGLKYSIAFLLRNNIDFKVFSEYREIKFSTISATLRDNSFERICVNGTETSMTTEMGFDWEAWFTIREIFCNALDEEDAKIEVITVDPISTESFLIPEDDRTIYYIEKTAIFDEIMNNWDLYFSSQRNDVIWYNSKGDTLYASNDTKLVYRRGIRCAFLSPSQSLFHYDLQNVEINESRIIKDSHDFNCGLRNFLMQNSDEKIVRHILNNINNCWEKIIYWNSSTHHFSDTWERLLKDVVLIPIESSGFWDDEIKTMKSGEYILLPQMLVQGLSSRFTDLIVIGGLTKFGEDCYKKIPKLTDRQTALYNKAVEFLAACNYIIEFPVEFVRFNRSTQLGQATDDNRILISDKVFDRGTKDIVLTLIEENEHLVTGLEDESRGFQQHWINKYVSAMEDGKGIYL